MPQYIRWIEDTLSSEKRRVVILILIYVLVTGFVLSHPHSLERPTIPDEKAYYEWAFIYLNGTLDMAVQDWSGIRAEKDILIDDTGPHTIDIVIKAADLNDTGKNDDVIVKVNRYDAGRVTPASGCIVTVRFQEKTRQQITDTRGEAPFYNLPDGFLTIEASYPIGGFNLKQGVIFFSPDGVAYQGLIEVAGYEAHGTSFDVTFLGKDILSDPIYNANVTITSVPSGARSYGLSSRNGLFNATLTPGGYHISYRKSPVSRGEPVFGTVVIVDGKPRVVNHWPPGYSFILAGMILLRLQEFTTILLMGSGAIAIYVLTRRVFDPMCAFFASAVYLTAGIAIALVWASGMADYASLTFACAGMASFAESIYSHYKRKTTRWLILGFVSGLLFAGGVWTRYSTATMLIAPLAFLVILLLIDLKERPQPDPGLTPGEQSLQLYKQVIKSVRIRVIQSLPFILGLLVLAAPLAWYNQHYFNSPFNSGHSYGSQISVSATDGEANATLRENNYFSNFNPSQSLATLDERLRLLPLVMPSTLAVPIVLGVRRRDILVWWGFICFGANFFLYLFVPWAAAWSDITRSLEDMRYFLPSLIGASTLCGVGLSMLYAGRKSAALIILAILILAGFASAGVIIDLQNARTRPPGPPAPPQPQEDPHKPVTIAMLVWNPSKYNTTLVRLENATFIQWVNPATFLVSDTSSTVRCAIRLDGYTPPQLNPNDRILIKGMFTWNDLNGNGIGDEKELTIGVKGGTLDGIWKT